MRDYEKEKVSEVIYEEYFLTFFGEKVLGLLFFEVWVNHSLIFHQSFRGIYFEFDVFIGKKILMSLINGKKNIEKNFFFKSLEQNIAWLNYTVFYLNFQDFRIFEETDL